MQRTQSLNHRILLIAGGLAFLAMALVGPRSPWGLLGLIPLFSGLVASVPLLQISGRTRSPG